MNDVTLPMAVSQDATSLADVAVARHPTLERIRSAARAGAAVSPVVVAAAAALGVSPRTVWRWLASGPPTPTRSPAWRPSSADVDAYVRWKGNAAAAWRERRRVEVAAVPMLRTFQAAIAHALTPGDRATVRDGVAGRRRHQVYLRWEPEARNERWETDHKQLDVPVLFPRAQCPRQPWVTMFIDGYSRAVMGWAISDQPSAATVLAALGEAIRIDPQCGPFGGLPGTLCPDRGLEFAATAVARACGRLTVRLAPAWPYQPTLKGKIERLHLSLIEQLLAEMPHFTGGPRDASGRLWASGLRVLTLAELVSAFRTWIDEYNQQRPHAALHGQTPMQRWLEDATPLRVVPADELRWTLLGDVDRKVITSGIRFHGLNYIAPELNGLVGETLQVRFRPHDDTSIEVFRDGAHLCTAHPQGTLGPEERAAVLARRRADAREQAARQRRATRGTRERLSPITATDPGRDVTVIPAIGARRRRRASTGDDLRRLARTDLLNLPRMPRG